MARRLIDIALQCNKFLNRIELKFHIHIHLVLNIARMP
jgi:hypothetical protein